VGAGIPSTERGNLGDISWFIVKYREYLSLAKVVRQVAARMRCFLILVIDGRCTAGQLRMPMSCQCRSSLLLNVSIDGASTTSCGSLFHPLTIRRLKKFCLTVVRHLGLNNFNECPLSPQQLVLSYAVTGTSGKKVVKVFN